MSEGESRQQRRARERLGRKLGLPGPAPAPNLQGDYHGACILCFQGCDTSFGVEGEPEFCVATLIHIGVPSEQASATFMEATGSEPSSVPNPAKIEVLCCQSCASKVQGLKVGLRASREIYTIKQPATGPMSPDALG